MSTKAERAFRVRRRIGIAKIKVPQSDGTVIEQRVECDARKDKRQRKGRPS